MASPAAERRALRILFAVHRLDVDRTSAAICAAGLIRAASATDHDVSILTDPRFDHPADALGPVLEFDEPPQSTRRGLLRALHWLQDKPAGFRPLRRAFNKVDGALALATGRGAARRLALDRWRHALRRCLAGPRPPYDLVVCCSAGTDFVVPLALLSEFGRNPPVPFVNQYHDPYPTSLYPPPYDEDQGRMSRIEEGWHRRMLNDSSVLGFPSARLRDWVLAHPPDDRPIRPRREPVLLPHPALGPIGGEAALAEEPFAQLPLAEGGEPLRAGGFLVVHTGSLLRPRDPWPLLRAWRRFVAVSSERRRAARLVHVGGAHRVHDACARAWAREPTARWIADRVPHGVALALSREASLSVVLEADAEESPFFPGKLADLLWLDVPVLGLSPARSVVADVLGDGHPLRVSAADEEAILKSLETAWGAWNSGPEELSGLRPRNGRRIAAPERVDEALRSALGAVA